MKVIGMHAATYDCVVLIKAQASSFELSPMQDFEHSWNPKLDLSVAKKNHKGLVFYILRKVKKF